MWSMFTNLHWVDTWWANGDVSPSQMAEQNATFKTPLYLRIHELYYENNIANLLFFIIYSLYSETRDYVYLCLSMNMNV